ncbi:PA14 domain-containing protein [Hymenobacter guriensis]|uniref:RICIN domain-containing protein n=1 Tax=Hymenobacter guriensis TaxID=2793065 RepID=A0ABS0L5D4_9BACT|nr:PA14 domain-containing protein [Hymenobacter guriensis]MBG8555346.1 RICIN domain-containing protein [Hymenobacter guriensis]
MRSLVLCSLVAGLCVVDAAVATAGGAPVVSAAPAQGAGTGLTASYFNNGTLAGSPAMRRIDKTLDFRWGMNPPAPNIPADYFSIRWEGLLAAPTTGTYRFVAVTTDEVRLWVNGRKVLDTWGGRKADSGDGFIQLAANEKTTFKLEFAAGEGDAKFQLQWMPPGRAPQVIPTGNLYPNGSTLMPDPEPGTAPAVAAAAPAPAPAAPAKKKEKVERKPPVPKTPVVAAAKPAPEPAKPVAKAEKPVAKAEKPVAKAEKPAKVTPPPPPPLEPAIYILTSRTTGRPLEVDDPSRPNMRAYQPLPVGTAVEPSTTPQWRIESLNNGFYRLMVPGNSRVLEVLGSSTSNGTPMNLWPYYSGNNQIWRIEPVDSGYYKIIAKHSNKALTARDSTDSGVQQWRYRDNENQHWKLQKITPPKTDFSRLAVNRPGIGTNNMSIYPNPSNGVAQLTYTLKEETPVGWVLYSQQGAVVRVSDYRRRPVGTQLQTLEFTDLPPGDYSLHLTVGTSTTRHQLLIRQPSATATGASATE